VFLQAFKSAAQSLDPQFGAAAAAVATANRGASRTLSGRNWCLARAAAIQLITPADFANSRLKKETHPTTYQRYLLEI